MALGVMPSSCRLSLLSSHLEVSQGYQCGVVMSCVAAGWSGTAFKYDLPATRYQRNAALFTCARPQ